MTKLHSESTVDAAIRKSGTYVGEYRDMIFYIEDDYDSPYKYVAWVRGYDHTEHIDSRVDAVVGCITDFIDHILDR